MAFIIPVAVGVVALAVLHSHQTIKVAQASYPTEKSPTVSIIIPAFNEAELIERTLLSIIHQNILLEYPDDFEIIVVDNESTDETALIASKYARVISAPRGKLNAMNAGVAAANGEIVMFFDADIVAPPNLLNLMLKDFQNPKVVAASGSPRHFEGINYLGDILWTTVNSAAQYKVNGGCLALRRDVFEALGGFNVNIDQFDRNMMQKEEEIGFMARLQEFGLVVVDSEATFYAPPRFQVCNTCDCEVECQYCTDIRTGQRF